MSGLSTDTDMNKKVKVYLVDWPAKMMLMLKKTYNQ